MEWHLIPTGRVWVDPGGPFGLVPRPLWSRHQKSDGRGLVPMDMNALLVYSDGKTILIDNGLGNKLPEKGRRLWNLEQPHGTLVDNLAKHGLTPNDIDIMLDTHLHSDHCSGNTTIQDGEVVPTFPRAEYLVQRLEWAEAMHPDARTRGTYLAENFVPVWQAGQFRFLHGDTQITSEVRCVLTRGHTRGHQSVIIETGGRPLFYVADLATYAVHMAKGAWVTAYDVEPLENISTKARWQRWALENEALIICEHDTRIPLGELVESEDGRISMRPVEHEALAVLEV